MKFKSLVCRKFRREQVAYLLYLLSSLFHCITLLPRVSMSILGQMNCVEELGIQLLVLSADLNKREQDLFLPRKSMPSK